MSDVVVQVLTYGLMIGCIGSSLSLLLGYLVSSVVDGVNKMTKV